VGCCSSFGKTAATPDFIEITCACSKDMTAAKPFNALEYDESLLDAGTPTSASSWSWPLAIALPAALASAVPSWSWPSSAISGALSSTTM
jgi:hypothetical protein